MYDYDTECTARQFIIDSLVAGSISIPRAGDPKITILGDQPRHWHICAKRTDGETIIRAFRPGAYTIFSSEHMAPNDKTVVVVVCEGNGPQTIFTGKAGEMNQRFNIECYVGIN